VPLTSMLPEQYEGRRFSRPWQSILSRSGLQHFVVCHCFDGTFFLNLEVVPTYQIARCHNTENHNMNFYEYWQLIELVYGLVHILGLI
jgi:hypothetical protein